jgi:cadmium resistance protein CadD (predicted permease)
VVDLGAAVVASIAFASTNLDDIVVLAVFFGHRTRHVPAIVLGQFLGIGALVAVSVIAALCAVAIPPRWLALLGLLPLALGLNQLRRRKQAEDVHGAQVSTVSVWTVASVTVANGGDNLSVYVPLFASHVHAIPIYVAVFAVGTAVWCGVGYALVQQRGVANALHRHGDRALPWVLIGIGGYVLWGARPL